MKLRRKAAGLDNVKRAIVFESDTESSFEVDDVNGTAVGSDYNASNGAGCNSRPRLTRQHRLDSTDYEEKSGNRLYIVLFSFGLAVVIGKIILSHGDQIQVATADTWQGVVNNTVTRNVLPNLPPVWHRFVVPVLAGAALTAFSWVILFLDSQTPGIQPPTPLSPKKFHNRSGHKWHLNYTLTALNGIALTLVLIWQQVA